MGFKINSKNYMSLTVTDVRDQDVGHENKRLEK